MAVVSLFGSVDKDGMQWKKREEVPQVLYWKLLFHASSLAGVQGSSVTWKLGAFGLRLPPVQAIQFTIFSTQNCKHTAMAWSATVKARRLALRG